SLPGKQHARIQGDKKQNNYSHKSVKFHFILHLIFSKTEFSLGTSIMRPPRAISGGRRSRAILLN
ncbi:MAG: hypothetical protein ACM3S2_16380, partial [Ignavibacteriales bacterium]